MSASPISNHPIQKTLWQDTRRFLFVVMGRRGGKTIYGLEWLLAGSDIPNTVNTYVAPTRDQGKEIAWSYLKGRCDDLRWAVDKNESNLTITRRNNSQVQIRSAEKEDRFRGKKFHRIVLDEYGVYKSPSIWTQAIRPALSDTRGQARFLLTPKGFNHAYELFQAGKTNPEWGIYQFKTCDSPFFQTPEGIVELAEARANLSDLDYKQEYEAEFVSHSGRIYYAFDRARHNTTLEYDPNCGPLYVGMDFNRSPMSMAVRQKISGHCVQIDEVFLRTGTTEACCQELRRRYPDVPVIIRPDATGNRKTSNTSFSDFEIIRGSPFYFQIEAASTNPRIIDRWAAVNRAFEKNLWFVNVKKCPNTVKDLETNKYKEGSCEIDMTDPFVGHIGDALGYDISIEYPILKPREQTSGHYA